MWVTGVQTCALPIYILLIEICLLQGGFTPIDVFSVEWIQSGTTHFGTTVSYFGFVSDGTT